MTNRNAATRWKKGQSGNPKGRPKRAEMPIGAGIAVARVARLALDYPITDEIDGKIYTRTRLMKWMFMLIEKADAGDARAMRIFFVHASRFDREMNTGKRGRGRPPLLTAWQKRMFRKFAKITFTAEMKQLAARRAVECVAGPPSAADLEERSELLPYSEWLKRNPDAERPSQDRLTARLAEIVRKQEEKQ